MLRAAETVDYRYALLHGLFHPSFSSKPSANLVYRFYAVFYILDACTEPIRMACRTQIPPDTVNGPRARNMTGDRNFHVIVHRNMFVTETKQTNMTSVHPSFLEQTSRQSLPPSACPVMVTDNY